MYFSKIFIYAPFSPFPFQWRSIGRTSIDCYSRKRASENFSEIEGAKKQLPWSSHYGFRIGSDRVITLDDHDIDKGAILPGLRSRAWRPAHQGLYFDLALESPSISSLLSSSAVRSPSPGSRVTDPGSNGRSENLGNWAEVRSVSAQRLLKRINQGVSGEVMHKYIVLSDSHYMFGM